MKYDLSKIVDWSTTCGIELTFVPTPESAAVADTSVSSSYWCSPEKPNESKHTSEWCLHLDNLYFKQFQGRPVKLRRRLVGYVGTDPGVVEHSSPILRSWDHARRWYKHATHMAAQADLTTYRDDYVGGGGHIHLGSTDAQTLKMMCDMYYRPYVAWACISPYDETNAKPLHRQYCTGSKLEADFLNKRLHHVWLKRGVKAVSKEFILHERYLRGDPVFPTYSSPAFSFNAVLRNRGHHPTVEWRAFDSAADWEIQELQLALALRYYQYVDKNPPVALPCKYGVPYGRRHGKKWILTPVETSTGIDHNIGLFRNFIEWELELPWKSYSWMVDRNLVPRLENLSFKDLTN